jgi:hypothetical protein
LRTHDDYEDVIVCRVCKCTDVNVVFVTLPPLSCTPHL